MNNVNDLYALYSKLGEVGVQARSLNAKQFNKARIAETLREAILKDLEQIPNVGDQFKNALAISRLRNQKFNSGTIGRILGKTREGESVIDPTQIFDKTIKKGQTGKLELDQLAKALSDDDQGITILTEKVSDFLRAKFVKEVGVQSGEDIIINPRKANTFLSNYKQILDYLRCRGY